MRANIDNTQERIKEKKPQKRANRIDVTSSPTDTVQRPHLAQVSGLAWEFQEYHGDIGRAHSSSELS